jgi:hypothetical protein
MGDEGDVETLFPSETNSLTVESPINTVEDNVDSKV